MRKKIDDINLKLLELNFQRYLSRAHTTFEACIGFVPTFILGMAGVFIGLAQADIVLYNKYYILRFSLPTIFIASFFSSVAIYTIFDSRNHRERIMNLIKEIRDC